MRDASSPSIALASALNFIGGTGSSSSELSPIEYGTVAIGGADMPLKVETRDRGDPRLRFGLEGRSRVKGREGGRLGKASWLDANWIGGPSAMAARLNTSVPLPPEPL